MWYRKSANTVEGCAIIDHCSKASYVPSTPLTSHSPGGSADRLLAHWPYLSSQGRQKPGRFWRRCRSPRTYLVVPTDLVTARSILRRTAQGGTGLPSTQSQEPRAHRGEMCDAVRVASPVRLMFLWRSFLCLPSCLPLLFCLAAGDMGVTHVGAFDITLCGKIPPFVRRSPSNTKKGPLILPEKFLSFRRVWL
jgi:hypothetical protein